MSEIIKFRAWSEEVGRWIYFDLDDAISGLVAKEFSPIRLIHKGRFTGQKDNNGIEIYEGDIVDTHHSNPYNKRPAEVYFDNDGARWYVRHSGEDDFDNGDYYDGNRIYDWTAFEVIGNIYQNKDLLKEQS